MSYAVNVFDRYSNGTWISVGNESSRNTINLNSSSSILFRITVPESFGVLTSFYFKFYASNSHSETMRWSLYGSNPGAATGYVPSGFFYSTTAQPTPTESAIAYSLNEFSASELSYDLSSSRTIYLLLQNFGSSSISIECGSASGMMRRATVDGRNSEPTLSWSSNTTTTDGSMLLSVSNLPAYTAVRVKYGSTNLESYTWVEDKQSVGILFPDSTLKQWFAQAGVATLQSITVTATVDGYPTVTASFTLTAGENMKPMVGTPTVSIVQPARIASTFPDTWIANISKAKVVANVSPGSNAAISSVVANYGSESVSMAYNSSTGSYEGTTSKPVTGDATFTVIVTDERGFTARSTCSITGVQAYSAPTITIDRPATYRCDSSGDEQSGGPYVRVKATANYTAITGNTLESFYFYVSEDGSSTTHNLTSGTQSAAYQLLSPRPDNAITVVVVAQDKISEAITARITLPGAHHDVIVARYGSKTVVGIGQVPTRVQNGTSGYCDGTDVAEGGGYFVGGRDIINLRGVARHGLALASLWGYDMLAVDKSNEKDAKNEAREFNLTASSLSNWQNLPAAIVTANTRFRGIREIRVGQYYVVATIVEIAPVAGRIWINQGMIGASVTWAGWKGYTPDIT